MAKGKKKKPRFRVLADHDNVNVSTAEKRQSELEKLKDILNENRQSITINQTEKPQSSIEKLEDTEKQGKRPSITINRAEISMHDITQLCQNFVVNKNVKRPKWVKSKDLKQPTSFIFARINCTIEQLLDEKKQLKFVSKFFNDKWTPVKAEVSNQVVYWDQILNVKIKTQEQLKSCLRRKRIR